MLAQWGWVCFSLLPLSSELGDRGGGAGLTGPLVSLSDWHSLRVGGLICAGILCALGIIVLMSEYRSSGGVGKWGVSRAGASCSFL